MALFLAPICTSLVNRLAVSVQHVALAVLVVKIVLSFIHSSVSQMSLECPQFGRLLRVKSRVICSVK